MILWVKNLDSVGLSGVILLHLGLRGAIQLADDLVWRVLDGFIHRCGTRWGWLEAWAQLGLGTAAEAAYGPCQGTRGWSPNPSEDCAHAPRNIVCI